MKSGGKNLVCVFGFRAASQGKRRGAILRVPLGNIRVTSESAQMKEVNDETMYFQKSCLTGDLH